MCVLVRKPVWAGAARTEISEKRLCVKNTSEPTYGIMRGLDDKPGSLPLRHVLVHMCVGVGVGVGVGLGVGWVEAHDAHVPLRAPRTSAWTRHGLRGATRGEGARSPR